MKIRRHSDNFRIVIEGAEVDLEGDSLDLTGLTREDLACVTINGNQFFGVPDSLPESLRLPFTEVLELSQNRFVVDPASERYGIRAEVEHVAESIEPDDCAHPQDQRLPCPNAWICCQCNVVFLGLETGEGERPAKSHEKKETK